MPSYYFLNSSLPYLEIGVPPPINSHYLTGLLRLNLSFRDYQKSMVMRRIIDIENLRALWLEKPFDVRGNFNDNNIRRNTGETTGS